MAGTIYVVIFYTRKHERDSTNKSVLNFLRTLITWHCPHSPAACTPLLPTAGRVAIDDRYLLSVAGPTTANLQQAAGLLLWANAGTDRRTHTSEKFWVAMLTDRHKKLWLCQARTKHSKLIATYTTADNRLVFNLYSKLSLGHATPQSY